ncbi:MAG: tetratricopeptide repeat protein [Acidobacteria bacterium]|nr:tetratricopeptide repeat protein [Acidobacteriota bacterium]
MRRCFIFALAGTALFAQASRDLQTELDAAPLPDNRARWAVVIGVSTYKYAPPAAQLKFAHRDAEDFAQFLRSPQGGAIPASHVRLLTEQQATAGGIRAALNTWLPQAAGPNDIVYLFLAGHAVRGDEGDGYFVAHDSDPQNLHATGIAFSEINAAIGPRLRASTVVLFADACHAGSIGWAGDRAAPSDMQSAIEALGARDRMVLKLLASRSREQSFEDSRWGGGHGIFTFAILNGLRGAAERTPDGVVRAAELLDYISRIVPEQTGARQNPRAAGNFEGSLPLAVLPVQREVKPYEPATLEIRGAPRTAVYIDDRFYGAVRDSGALVVANLRPGAHRLSLEEQGQTPLEQEVSLLPGSSTLDITTAAEFALARFERLLRTGDLKSAWDRYAAQPWTAQQRPLAAMRMAHALEDSGQACVSDYVQSTAIALKAAMFLRAAESFRLLKTLRPNEPALDARALFCRARAEIAGGLFSDAESNLRQSLQLDPNFACSYNALGVALQRQGRAGEAREAFEKARKLTPNWALPPLQIAQLLIAANELNKARPYLEESARLFPRAVGIQWSLARLNRVLKRDQDFLTAANAAIAIDPNYAPTYAELGAYHEAIGDSAKAAQAYEKYLALAPNFTDSTAIRDRIQRLRKPAPTLRRTN